MDLLTALQSSDWFRSVAHETQYIGVRYFIYSFVAFMFFYLVIGVLLPHKKIQKSKLKWQQAVWEVSWSTLSIFILSATIGTGTWLVFGQWGGGPWGGYVAPMWMQYVLILPLMILFHDAYFYWVHRAMHHPWLYKHVHAVHHRSTDPTSLAAFSFHPFEAFLEAMVLPLMFLAFPADGYMYVLYTVSIFVINVVNHSGYELYPHRLLRWFGIQWITTPTHHNMHHRTFNYNFGLYTNFWDRLMRTEHKLYQQHFERVAGTKSYGPDRGVPPDVV